MSKQKDGISSGRPGSRNVDAEYLISRGDELFSSPGNWVIYLDKTRQRVKIDTTDYRAGTLVLSKEALRKILEELEK